MTPEKREQAVKWLTEEVRSLRMAPKINGCGPENWQDQLEIMEACLEAVRDYHFPDTKKMIPLTLEQLREMLENGGEIIGAPVIVSENGVLSHGVLDERSDDGICAAISASVRWLKEKDYEETWVAYAYSPAHIDWAWEPCELCAGDKLDGVGVGDYFGLRVYLRGGDKKPPENERFQFCPKCGRPRTSAAWAELEKRLRG